MVSILVPLIFCLLLGGAQSGTDMETAAGEKDTVIPSFRTVENNAFMEGERLVFDLSYGIIRAGEGEMRIPEITSINGREAYRVQLTARSVSPFSWVYRVEDLWETYIDTEGLFPWRFTERIREGGYRRNTEVEFDQKNNLAITNDGEFSIPEYVHNMVSAFYYVRTMDFNGFEEGDSVTLENFHRDTTYSLAVVYHGREEVKVKTGTFKTILIEPLIKEGGLFKHEGAIYIWLTDDDLRVPVQMRTRVPVGSITAELSRYSGLRDAIRARVQ